MRKLVAGQGGGGGLVFLDLVVVVQGVFLGHAQAQSLVANAVSHPRIDLAAGDELIVDFGSNAPTEASASGIHGFAKICRGPGGASERKPNVAREEELGQGLAADVDEKGHLNATEIGQVEIVRGL